MKYSFMTFSTPQLTLDEVLGLAKRIGYDGIEARAAKEHAHGVELDTDADQRSEIKQKAADAGIAICCVSASIRYADPATNPEARDDTLRYIDLAADVAAPIIRVFGGPIPEGITRDAAKDLLVESLSSVAEHATQRGVIVCIETHDDWCDPQDLADVLSRVDNPAIAVNWDIMHPIMKAGATMDEAFNTLKPWIRHLHVHDGDVRDGKRSLVPIGEGKVDHRRAIELLRTISFDGYLSGEWIKWDDPYESHLPRELATLKGYEKELS